MSVSNLQEDRRFIYFREPVLIQGWIEILELTLPLIYGRQKLYLGNSIQRGAKGDLFCSTEIMHSLINNTRIH